MSRSRWGAYAAVALAAASWGTWPLWLRGELPLPPIAQATVVLGTVGLVGLPFALVARARARRQGPRRGAWLRLAGLVASDACNYLLYFGALAAGPVAAGVLSHYLTPVLLALLAPRLLGDPRSRRALPGAAVALAGLALVVLTAPGATGGGGATVAAGLGAGSAIFYAIAVLLGRRMNASREWTPIEAVAFHCLGSGILLAPIEGQSLLRAEWMELVGLAIPACLLGIVGGTAFYWGLSRMPAAHAGVLTYLEPVVAVGVGAALLHEPLGVASLGGAALILAAGLAVVTEPPSTSP